MDRIFSLFMPFQFICQFQFHKLEINGFISLVMMDIGSAESLYRLTIFNLLGWMGFWRLRVWFREGRWLLWLFSGMELWNVMDDAAFTLRFFIFAFWFRLTLFFLGFGCWLFSICFELGCEILRAHLPLGIILSLLCFHLIFYQFSIKWYDFFHRT